MFVCVHPVFVRLLPPLWGQIQLFFFHLENVSPSQYCHWTTQASTRFNATPLSLNDACAWHICFAIFVCLVFPRVLFPSCVAVLISYYYYCLFLNFTVLWLLWHTFPRLRTNKGILILLQYNDETGILCDLAPPTAFELNTTVVNTNPSSAKICQAWKL